MINKYYYSPIDILVIIIFIGYSYIPLISLGFIDKIIGGIHHITQILTFLTIPFTAFIDNFSLGNAFYIIIGFYGTLLLIKYSKKIYSFRIYFLNLYIISILLIIVFWIQRFEEIFTILFCLIGLYIMHAGVYMLTKSNYSLLYKEHADIFKGLFLKIISFNISYIFYLGYTQGDVFEYSHTGFEVIFIGIIPLILYFITQIFLIKKVFSD